MIWREVECSVSTIVAQFCRVAGSIWVVGREVQGRRGFSEAIQDKPVVDRDARKAKEMNYRRRPCRKGPRQMPGCSLLMPAGDEEDHSPMAAQGIGLPGSATFGFQKLFLSLAEGAQTLVAWNHDSLGLETGLAICLENRSKNPPASAVGSVKGVAFVAGRDDAGGGR